MSLRLALAALVTFVTLPAAAQDTRTFQPPAGCTAYLTIQTAECSVSHYLRCANDPEGWQRRVDMDEGGIAYFGAIDFETQWVESFHALSGHSERLAPNPVDPASFTELLETGADNYDFQTLSDEIGTTRYVGGDSLTGVQVTIDGVVLDETRYAIRAIAADGSEVWRSEGNEFISRDFRMFLAGPSTITVGSEVWESDDRPVEFVFPDEPGFLSVSPKHGCGLTMSSLTLP